MDLTKFSKTTSSAILHLKLNQSPNFVLHIGQCVKLITSASSILSGFFLFAGLCPFCPPLFLFGLLLSEFKFGVFSLGAEEGIFGLSYNANLFRAFVIV